MKRIFKVILVIVGIIILLNLFAVIFNICPPQGDWIMPPWCGEKVKISDQDHFSTVSGTIYFRNPEEGYSLKSLPKPQISGAEVKSSSATGVSDDKGNYELSLISTFDSITATKEGYIPIKISWDFLPNENYTFNIALYKLPTEIKQRSGFLKGIITWDAGGWLIGHYYKRGLFQTTYGKIKKDTNANLVTVSDPIFIKEVGKTRVRMGTVSNNGKYGRMMNRNEYKTLVDYAHSKELQFMLWLGVMEDEKSKKLDGLSYGEIVYNSGTREKEFWDSWFSEYEKYAVEYAKMAEELGIDYISLGHNLGHATGASKFKGGAQESLNYWKKLTDSIRSVYTGKLVYFGGTNPTNGYFEDEDYPNGFIDLFDYIGVNVQNINPKPNPSINELKSSISGFLNRYTKWNMPIFIMIYTPSVDGGTSFATYIEPLLVVNDEADKHKRNLFQQADIYEAFFEVINSRPTGNGQVMGLFSWGYDYQDEYLEVLGKASYENKMAMDKSANIRGKPAEEVFSQWYASID